MASKLRVPLDALRLMTSSLALMLATATLVSGSTTVVVLFSWRGGTRNEAGIWAVLEGREEGGDTATAGTLSMTEPLPVPSPLRSALLLALLATLLGDLLVPPILSAYNLSFLAQCER